MVLTHASVTETNEVQIGDFDLRFLKVGNEIENGTADSLPYYLDAVYDFIGFYENENSESHVGKYFEDWSDSNGQGWGHSGSVDSQNQNSYYYIYYDGSSGSDYTSYITSPVFSVIGQVPQNLSFRAYMYYYNCCTKTMTYEVSYNGGSWETLSTNNSPGRGVWYDLNFDLSPPADVTTMRFRVKFYYRYWSECIVDDFELITNIYPGEDIATSLGAAFTPTLSTGGIEMYNTEYLGDFYSLNDTLSVVLENSSIGVNPSRDKDSHGLGLYADDVTIESNNASVSDHALDGLHVESLTTSWTSTEDVIDGNGGDGIYRQWRLGLDFRRRT